MQRRRGIISAVIVAVQICVLSAVLALAHGSGRAGATGSIAITGDVTSQSGAGIADVSVYATAPGDNTAEFGPTATASDGSYTLYVDAGTYDFHFDPASGSGLTPVVDSSVTVLGDQTINAQLVPPAHTFSGTVTDQNGNPIAGLNLSLSNSQFSYHATTDAAGNYSMAVNAAVYTGLTLSPTYSNGVSGYALFTDHSIVEDLSSTDVTQNFTLSLTKLSIVVKDAAGNPAAGMGASEVGNGSTTVTSGGVSYPFGVYIDAGETTDSTGTGSILVPVGTYFGAGFIDAQFPDGKLATNSTAFTMNKAVSVIFQEGEPVVEPPAAPANLAAPSPTQTPALTWNAATGATSYNIYRNGAKIASTTTTAYTDTTAVEGTQTYYVTAANNDGESDPSNSVSVVVDRTPPAITYTLNPSPNANGWNNTAVTVTFACTDNLAGVANCPAAQTISTEGRNQSLSVTATDKAGNTANLTVSGINVDTTAPTVSGASMSSTLILFSGHVTVSANAADALSGVTGGEFYIDTDPGIGNGTRMTYANGKLSATTTISGLRTGRHTLYIRSQDAAGNWSTTTSITFTFV